MSETQDKSSINLMGNFNFFKLGQKCKAFPTAYEWAEQMSRGESMLGSYTVSASENNKKTWNLATCDFGIVE